MLLNILHPLQTPSAAGRRGGRGRCRLAAHTVVPSPAQPHIARSSASIPSVV